MDTEVRRRLVSHLKDFGAITRWEARQIGLSDRELAGACTRLELVNPRHSLYIPSHVPDTRWHTVNQDVRAMRPVAFAARRSALWLAIGSYREVPFRREILVPVLNGPHRAEPPVVHRTRRLDEIDVRIVNGIRSTTLPRTLVDLAAELHPVVLTALLDHAIANGYTTQGQVFARATALRHGRRGVGELVQLTQPGAAALFFSKLERLGAPLLRAAGLTDVEFNVVPRRAPDAGRCDGVSERYLIVVDWDGLRFHASPQARQLDNNKGNALAGRYRHLRFTWRDLFDRPGVISAHVHRLTSLR